MVPEYAWAPVEGNGRVATSSVACPVVRSICSVNPEPGVLARFTESMNVTAMPSAVPTMLSL